MPTTVHPPADLLKRRNRCIRGALESAVRQDTGWSPAFLQMLGRAAADAELQQGVDQIMRAIALRRATRKRPPKL